MTVGVAFLIGISFVTPGTLARFGLPEAWADTGTAVWVVFAAISVVGGVLWWLGWRRNDG